jgi:hypothetical protein
MFHHEYITCYLEFATLLTQGSIETLEVGLGALSRLLLAHHLTLTDDEILLLLTAILSSDIAADSPSRISILALISYIDSWEEVILTPSLDSFLEMSLSEGSPLIAEQTLDFIATHGGSYIKAPHDKGQLIELDRLIQLRLSEVDDSELRQEWTKELKDGWLCR